MTLESLLSGNFLEGAMAFETRIVAYFALKALAAIALLGFYLVLTGTRRSRWMLGVYAAATTAIVVGAAVDFNWGSRSLSIAQLKAIATHINSFNAYTLGLGMACFLGLILWPKLFVSRSMPVNGFTARLLSRMQAVIFKPRRER